MVNGRFLREKSLRMSKDLFSTGIRPHVDDYLLKKSQEKRDYGEYWSASSAGYCMRKLIFERLGVPSVNEDARKTRIFESGHVFHSWIQNITKEAGLSIAQELELQDEKLMIRGHIDDLILLKEEPFVDYDEDDQGAETILDGSSRIILYDYKTAHSKSFHWAKKNGTKMSHYHKMQLGTYMYMLRNLKQPQLMGGEVILTDKLKEARILKISKDDLCMDETQLMWSSGLEKEVVQYWSTLNGYWKAKQVPKCTCADFEGGFMAREAYNPFFYDGEPCSLKWLSLQMKKGLLKNENTEV